MPGSQSFEHGRKKSVDPAERGSGGRLPQSRLSTEIDRDDAHAAEPGLQKQLVFTDPIAFRYLEGEDGTTVVARRQTLAGYELYVVEQWACSRKHLTFVITTFTGQESHSVGVDVLGVPVDQAQWSPRLRAYLAGLAELPMREKETPLGSLMVTNLSSFPSALTVIPVPGGDIRPLRETFIINENLKRLGCSGRAGLELTPPSAATRAKFGQLYRTSELVPLNEAVIELVKMCQFALVLFTVLDSEYADGLLCDLTEQAIRDWWTKFGSEFYNVEPSDGILGPTTVAGLLGMLLGARNRLKDYGASMAKDVFDLKATRRGIAYFQKWQKIKKTKKLDPETFERLQRVTSKAANNEGWAVPKAVKSTVADLSGKGGEMVMGIVRKDKPGIAEVETVDMSTFIATVSGERSKWLWHGKQSKNPSVGVLSNLTVEDGDVFSGDENALSLRRSRTKELPADYPHLAPTHSHLERIYSNASTSQTSLEQQSDKEPALRKAVLKSMTGRMNDAKTGLGRFRDAVGRTSLHRHGKLSRDESALMDSEKDDRRQEADEADSRRGGEDFSAVDRRERDSRTKSAPGSLPDGPSSPPAEETSPLKPIRTGTLTASEVVASPIGLDSPFEEAPSSRLPSAPAILSYDGFSSTNVSSTELLQAQDKLNEAPQIPPTFRSTLSLVALGAEDPFHVQEARLPRNISFEAVEALSYGTSDYPERNVEPPDLESYEAQWAEENLLATQIKQRIQQLQDLDAKGMELARTKRKELQDCEVQAQQNFAWLNEGFYKRSEEYESLRQGTNDLIGEEKASLSDALKDIEVLSAKLEYELNALLSKVEDVEDGVSDFERQVQYLEERMAGLEDEETRDQPWYRRLSRLLLGGL